MTRAHFRASGAVSAISSGDPRSSAPWRPLSRLPRVLGIPSVRGVIRERPEDFRVDEFLDFSPDGAGEHLLLQIRKRNTNTDWMARRLAAWADVPLVDVSYAGLKDRYALTTQWFSVRLAGRLEPDWRTLETEDVQILRVARHGRKLRRGALQGNRFRILVRGLEGEQTDVERRLVQIGETGIPNFFGEQRFGHDYGNLEKAERLFSDVKRRVPRYRRGLYLSAVRSQLFNEVLGRRIESQTWDVPLDGDLMWQGKDLRLSRVDTVDEAIRSHARALRIHPTGPLWGRGALSSGGGVKKLEEETLANFPSWCRGLERAGLKQARRPLRVRVGDLGWEWREDGALELGFRLPPGSYATMMLRELILTVQDRRGVPGREGSKE